MSAAASLDAFIAGVEQLRGMNELSAKEAEPGVLAAARATASAGQAPDGKPWPKKADGGKALEGAAGAIKSSAKGSRVELAIEPPWTYHHHGAGGSSTTKEAARHRQRTATRHAEDGTKSKFHAPRRQIIPVQGDPVPAPMKKAIADASKRVFEKATGG